MAKFYTDGDEILRDGLYRLWILLVEGDSLSRRGEERSLAIAGHDYLDNLFCSRQDATPPAWDRIESAV
jgi:hypothetical protein